jgi:hypothetical protein
MASSGTPRHSKKSRPGVTIDLAPAEVETVAAADEPEVTDRVTEDILPEPEPIPAEAAPANEDVLQSPPSEPIPSARPVRGVSGLASGLAGGALALLAGAGLQWAGVLPSFGGGAEIAALRQQVTALSEKPGAPAMDTAAIDTLKSGQTALTQNVEQLRADISTAGEAQKSLSDDVAALKLSGGAADDPATMAAVTDKIAALQAQLDAVKGGDASAKLDAMQAQIADLKQSAGSQTGASNVAQAIAAAGLKAAIDRGGAFANELETFATVAPASPELEQLKNLAASGVPSKAELSAEFGKAADAMLAAAQPVDPNAGLIARLTASAKGLVRSRPVGAIEGDTPEALVARVEVAVNKGDLDAALAEAGKLPDAARAAGIEYIGKLTARRDTDALVTKALTSALSAAGAAK